MHEHIGIDAFDPTVACAGTVLPPGVTVTRADDTGNARSMGRFCGGLSGVDKDVRKVDMGAAELIVKDPNHLCPAGDGKLWARGKLLLESGIEIPHLRYAANLHSPVAASG